jgi:ankyrin repeat protein
LNAGADLNLVDLENNSAFHYACIKGSENILQFLVKKESLKPYLVNKNNKNGF